ncbi:MAG: 3'-5' exonuclease [Moorea sp. SIO4G2]|nr:3'-5' exonuclease [Moorena sp. SIO4G2]
MPTIIQAKNQAIIEAQQVFANPDQFVILDLETTGLGSTADITEIGVLSLKNEVLAHYYISSPNQVLNNHGSCDFSEAYPHLAEILSDRTVIAYNLAFDRSVLNTVTKRHNLPPLVSEKGLCAMQLRKKWEMVQTVTPLDGPHEAIGDCRLTLTLLKDIASSGLEVDDYDLPIVTLEDFKTLVSHLQKITRQRLVLDKIEKQLKAKSAEYLTNNGEDEILLNSEKKIKRVPGVHAEKLVSEVPEEYLTTRINNKAVKEAIEAGTLPEGLFKITPVWNVKIVKAS